MRNYPESPWSSGFDAAQANRDFFRGASSVPFVPPSMDAYYQSRATTESALGPAAGYTSAPGSAGFTPTPPPYRISGNILDTMSGKSAADAFAEGVTGSALGVFAGLGEPEQRRGATNFGPIPLATTPLNFMNGPSYFREGFQSVITSALGHKYQQGPNGEAPTPPSSEDLLRNISQVDLPGILDNVISGVNAVGDVVGDVAAAPGNYLRDTASHDRAVALAGLFATGKTGSTFLQFFTHLWGDQSTFNDLQRVQDLAAKKGISDDQLLASLWNLSPEAVTAIRDGVASGKLSGKTGIFDFTSGLSAAEEGYIGKITKGTPFSYSAFDNTIAELVVNLAPLLIGAGELKGAALALKAIPVAAKELGFTGSLLKGLGAAETFGSAAAKLEMWSLPTSWRFIRPVIAAARPVVQGLGTVARPLAKGLGAAAGITPTGIKLGIAIRAGEWLLAEGAVLAGDKAALDTVQRWLYEMPMSNNPGLNIIDAFSAHPIKAAKSILKGPATVAFNRALDIAGFGDVPISLKAARALGSVKTMSLADLQSRMLDRMGWDPAEVQRVFASDGSDLSVGDLKNALYHVALEAVREKHPETRFVAQGADVPTRNAEFVKQYGDEAAQLLKDELNGKGTSIVDAMTGEFWTRMRMAEQAGSRPTPGQIGQIGPYHAPTAFLHFAGWTHVSKVYRDFFGGDTANSYVAGFRSDVNLDFVNTYRAELKANYPKAGDFVSQSDLLRLTTYVPEAKRIKELGASRVTPKIKRSQLEGYLDELTANQNIIDARALQPRTGAVPAISEADAGNPMKVGPAFNLDATTISALQHAITDGVETMAQVPADLARVLSDRTVAGLTAEAIRTDPQAAWTKAVAWYQKELGEAVDRGKSLATIDRFGRVVDRLNQPAEVVRVVKLALEAVKQRISHPYALKDPEGRPIGPYLTAYIRDTENRSVALVDRAEHWLKPDGVAENPLIGTVVNDLSATDLRPILDIAPNADHSGFNNITAQEIVRFAEVVLTEDAHSPLPGLNAADRALLGDPAAHPLELTQILRESGARFSENDRAFIDHLPTLEDYGPLMDAVHPGENILLDRTGAERLTKEALANAAERDAIITEARDIARFVDARPGATYLPDRAALIDDANALGTSQIGRTTEQPTWRTLPIERRGVELASNETQIRGQITALERDLNVAEGDALKAEAALGRASTHAGQTEFTAQDFDWAPEIEKVLDAKGNERPGTFGTRKEATALAARIAAEGTPARVIETTGPRGGKAWAVVRGQLKERATTPEPAPIEPPVSPEAAAPEAAPPAPVAGGWAEQVAARFEGKPPGTFVVEPDTIGRSKGKWRVEGLDSSGQPFSLVNVTKAEAEARAAAASSAAPEGAPAPQPKPAPVVAPPPAPPAVAQADAQAAAFTRAKAEQMTAQDAFYAAFPEKVRVPHAPAAEWVAALEGSSRGNYWPTKAKAAAQADRLNASGVGGLEYRVSAKKGDGGWYLEARSTATRPAPVSVPIVDPMDNTTKINAHAVIVDAHDLLTSADPLYPQEFQPRDRAGRVSSEQQIRVIGENLNPDLMLSMPNSGAEGAPVISPDGFVVSGNGRTQALRIAPKEKFAAYKEALKIEAAKYGFDPAVIDGMERPILVRQLEGVSPDTMQRLGWQLNIGKGLPLGDLSIAFARDITPSELDAFKIGENQSLEAALQSSKNDALVRGILDHIPPDNRSGFFDNNGDLNADGLNLVTGAMFARMLRADVEGPHVDAARQLLQAVTEKGGEEIRPLLNGAVGAAGQMVKAVQDGGLALDSMPVVTDKLVAALNYLLERRRPEGYVGDSKPTMSQLSIELQTTEMFPEPGGLGPVERHLAAVLADSAQTDVTAFLRGVADAAQNAAQPGLMFESAVDPTGLLNSGLLKWNEARRKGGRAEIDNFPDEQGRRPLGLARNLPDGNTAPPVIQHPTTDTAGLMDATAPGPRVIHAETLHGVTNAPGAAVERVVSDPNARAFLEAYRADPEVVRDDVIESIGTAFSFSDDAIGDYVHGLVVEANKAKGDITPGERYVLDIVLGGEIRRNSRGKINNAPELGRIYRERIRAAAPRSIADLDALLAERAGEPAPHQVVLHPQEPITPEALAEVAGAEVPHGAVQPVAEELLATADHSFTEGRNPAVEAQVRRTVTAPAIVKGGVLEFNTPTAAAQVERLSAVAQSARAAAEAKRVALTEFKANPTIPAFTERASVFDNPVDRELYQRLMTAHPDERISGFAEAIGGEEPHSLSSVDDAIASIDHNAYVNPITGKGLTPEEAGQLRSTLMSLMAGTIQGAHEKAGKTKAGRTMARVRQKQINDYSADQVGDAYDRAGDLVAAMVVPDQGAPKIEGFAGTQYRPTPPANAVGTQPPLLFRDWLDVVPGLSDELASRRQMTWDERVARHRFIRVIDHIVGPRSTRAMHETAISNFSREIERALPGGLVEGEAKALQRGVDAAMQKWNDHLVTEKIGAYSTYRRIDLVSAGKVDLLFKEAFGAAAPGIMARLEGTEFSAHKAWRRADNRIRQILLDQHAPLTDKIESYYGAVTDSALGRAGRVVTMLYHIARFTGEIRWLALEAIEGPTLTFAAGGLNPVLEANSRGRASRAGGEPLGFGGMSQRTYMRDYAHWANNTDLERVTPLRWRYLNRELARRQTRPFAEVFHEMTKVDPQLKRMLVDMGEPGKPLTAFELMGIMDRDWRLLEQGERRFASPEEASNFFRPWLRDGVIDEAKFNEYVKAQRYTTHGAIEAELAKTVGQPVANALYTRLAQINHEIMHDLTSMMFGQENRSNLQRALNHPFLYWPISYQIKTTKWLLRFMGEEAFGVDSGMLGAVGLSQVYERHKQLMATSEQYRRDLQGNSTLYFLAQMLLPISPTDIGVSLSPWTRMALSQTGTGPHYERPFGILGFGYFTTLGYVARAMRELNAQGSLGPLGDALQQDFPVPSSRRSGTLNGAQAPATSRMAYALDQFPGQPIPQPQYPEVPRLP